MEGTFGEFVQRWGVLWRPLRCAAENQTLLLTVLAKLHNLCIDAGFRAPREIKARWTGTREDGYNDMPYESGPEPTKECYFDCEYQHS